VIGEHFDDFRKSCQSLDRSFPRLCIHVGKIAALDRVLVVDQPAIGLNDLKGKSAGLENKEQQRIGIQCDGSEHLLEVRDGVSLSLRRSRARRGG